MIGEKLRVVAHIVHASLRTDDACVQFYKGHFSSIVTSISIVYLENTARENAADCKTCAYYTSMI